MKKSFWSIQELSAEKKFTSVCGSSKEESTHLKFNTPSILQIHTTNLSAMKKTSWKGHGRHREDLLLKRMPHTNTLENTLELSLTPKASALNFTLTVTTPRSCSTASLTVSTAVKSMKRENIDVWVSGTKTE